MISGPTLIRPTEECTWEALTSDGVSPYTYNWYYDGLWVGSGSSWTGGLNSGDLDDEFVLEVHVMDSKDEHDQDSLLVQTSESAFACPS